MAICIVRIYNVVIDLVNKPTIKIVLPKDYRTNYISDAKGRKQIEEEKDRRWIRQQIDKILNDGKGHLATEDHPMRSYGSGILARVWSDSLEARPVCILHVRGSNRGSVWPLGMPISDVLCWKEFAGVTGSPEELFNPRLTAIKELYEEVTFVSNDQILLPFDIHSYMDTFVQVRVAIDRINKHYHLALSPAYGYYSPVLSNDLQGDAGTTVLITDGQKEEEFNAVVNYDPVTNALEISFMADIRMQQLLTGILSLSGPENNDTELQPYMEDVIVVREDYLKEAQIGRRLYVRHLLSVHGPMNLMKTQNQLLFYTPAPTLVPLVWFLGGTYSFRRTLEESQKKL